MILLNGQPLAPEALTTLGGQSAPAREILNAMAANRDVFTFSHINILQFDIRLRAALVQAAHDMNNSQVRFATFYYSKCNEKYWNLTEEGGFRLRQDASPSAAINDIFHNGQLYAFECATAMVILLFKAVMTAIGSARFDAVYRNIYLWDWHEDERLPLVIETVADHGIPGDIRYFKNPQVNPRTPQWQGENAVELPNGYYYGHGVGIKKADGVIDALNKNRRAGATVSAYLMNRATRLDTARLAMITGFPGASRSIDRSWLNTSVGYGQRPFYG